MLKHLFTLLLLICTLPIFSADVKYIFVLIGDGFGPSQRALAEAAIGKKLVMNTFPCAIPTGTDTHDGKLTDSAASGTAIACGIKTYAHAIGVDKNKKPVESLACELKRTKDFQRFQGEKVQVKTFSEVEGKKQFIGILQETTEETVTLDVDGASIVIPRKQIGKANLVWEF